MPAFHASRVSQILAACAPVSLTETNRLCGLRSLNESRCLCYAHAYLAENGRTQLSNTTRLLTATSVGVLAFALAACSSSKPASSPTASPGSGTSAPGTSVPAAKLFSDDFRGVCQGAGVSRATAYTKGAPSHKLILFSANSGSLTEDTTTLPSDWVVQFDANTDAYAKADTVACVQVKDDKPLKECTGYQNNGHDTKNKVDLRTATYTVAVHEATTGTVLGQTELAGTDDSCPMFMTFDDENQSKTYDAPPSKDQLIAFIKPFVQP
jgi:hypothetical protein